MKPIKPDLSDFENENGEISCLCKIQTLCHEDRFLSLVESGKNEGVIALMHAEKEERNLFLWVSSVIDISIYNDNEESKEGQETGEVDEDENPILYKPNYKEYPEKPSIQTFEEWKALRVPEYLANLKKTGFDYNGVQVSLSLENQSGIVDLDYAEGIASSTGSTLFPLNFKVQTPSGFDSIRFETHEEFTGFAMQFLPRRKDLF